MHTCSRCGKLPDLTVSFSDVYLTLPTHHHREGFESELKRLNQSYKEVDDGYLIEHVDFDPFIRHLCHSVFNSIEQKDVMVLSLKCGEALSFASIKRYKRLSEWMRWIHGQEVACIIEEGRIKTLFQPIIDGKTGEIYGYEALSRGIMRDGLLMNPEVLFRTAKEMDLMFFLDRVCRESSIKAAAKHGIKEKIFINFIPTAIYEPSLCLQSTAKVLNDENIREDQVVFEVVETERVEDFKHLNRILDYYKAKGYSTALDDIGSGFADLDALMNLKPDYMKIDMAIIRDIHVNPDNQNKLNKFITYGKKIGLKILAEGIETQEEYAFLKQKNVDLFQGYLFGKPEEVPLRL